jgi:hypothetical protein
VLCDLSALMRPTDKRLKSVLTFLRSARKSQCLSPHDAAVLLGRLSWILASSYGSTGRAATLPLVSRAARHSRDEPSGSTYGWNAGLSWMLDFFEAYFVDLPPLRFDFSIPRRPKVVVYTHASFSDGAGGMGAILFDEELDARFVCACRVPSWFTRALEHRASQINQFEMLALASVVSTLGDAQICRAMRSFVF